MIRFERNPNFTRAAGRGIREWEWDENGMRMGMEEKWKCIWAPGRGSLVAQGGHGGDQVEGRRKGGPRVRQGVESRVDMGAPGWSVGRPGLGHVGPIVAQGVGLRGWAEGAWRCMWGTSDGQGMGW